MIHHAAADIRQMINNDWSLPIEYQVISRNSSLHFDGPNQMANGATGQSA